jgi:Ino eighty subunit 1
MTGRGQVDCDADTPRTVFPEMRAQLRTYHSIPALQAHQDPNAYKQLQDAPRLKSILKGATEDEPQPSTMDEIKAAPIPRTNPVNLIFVMSQYAPKISELHFPPPRDFFDLVMRPSLGSASRARAFLWLVWWYLESDFSKEDSLRNPFGPGEHESEEAAADAVPLRVPALNHLTEEQTADENIDTEIEKNFGEVKRKERIAILASEPSPAMTALKRARKEKGLTTGHGPHASDDEGSEMGGYLRGAIPSSVKMLQHETASDYTRSPSPAASRGFQAVNAQPKPAGDMRINNLLNSDHIMPDQSPPRSVAPTPTAPLVAKKGPGRGNWRRNKNKPEAAAAPASTPSGSRIVHENHHVPLLPNTGQINFPAGPPSAPEYNSTPSGGGSFNVFANKGAMSPPQHPGLPSSSAYPMNPGGAPLVANGMSHIPTPSYQAQKRNRGVTQHQSAIMTHRKQQINYTLDNRIRKAHHRFRRVREGESPIIRAWKRIRTLDPAYDSEEEGIKIRKARARGEKDEDDGATLGWGRGKGRAGEAEADAFQADVDSWRRSRCLYAGYVRANGEQPDLGEEVRTLAKSFRRLSRRLDRWGDEAMPGAAMLRRMDMEARGGYKRQRMMEIEEEDYLDRMDVEEDPAPAVRAPAKRVRKRRPPVVKVEPTAAGDSHLPSQQPDEDADGRDGAELDEEDRELLGEVDADLDESEDDDGDGEGDGEDDVDMDD